MQVDNGHVSQTLKIVHSRLNLLIVFLLQCAIIRKPTLHWFFPVFTTFTKRYQKKIKTY